jgi:hypothetical protein
MTAHAKIQDGRRDFDFLQGRWNVLHRRLTLRGAGSDAWDEFEGAVHCQTLMGGLCNVDENDISSRGFQGLSFRTFNIERREWSIYWVNSDAGVLQEPVFGRFEDGVGRFYGVDVDNGRPVQVIYIWKDITPTSAHWAQAFSYDGGRSWEVNWTMAFSRAE